MVSNYLERKIGQICDQIRISLLSKKFSNTKSHPPDLTILSPTAKHNPMYSNKDNNKIPKAEPGATSQPQSKNNNNDTNN